MNSLLSFLRIIMPAGFVFSKDERGATAIEYALIAAGIAQCGLGC